MKSKQIIATLADTCSITKTQATQALKVMEGSIASSLVMHGEYQLDGIGKLKVKDRAQRTGRNPKTGEPLQIPAKKAITFTTAKALSEALNV